VTFHMWTAPSSQGVLQCFDQIACVHMSGLWVRSHMNAGQDGFRDPGSKQQSDRIEKCQVAGHCWDPVGLAIVEYAGRFARLTQAAQDKV